jgi:DNA-binding MarR family transcriptional regulator
MSRVNLRRDPVDRLHSAAIHLLRRVRDADGESGLSAARLSALSVIAFREPLTLGELAAAERVTAPTMTRIVDALERDRLVRREAHPDDGRAVRIRMTAKGHRLFARARQGRLDLLDRLFAGATRAELETIGRAADLVERALRDA